VGAGFILLTLTVASFIWMRITWAHGVVGMTGALGLTLAWILVASLAC
jgi:hypothetical protein